MSVAQKIIIMLLLKTAPQDLPFSAGLLVRVIFIYFISGIIVVGDAVEPNQVIGQMLLNVFILLFFCYLLLFSLNLKARFVQTCTALIGTGIVFNLLAWPILGYYDLEQASDFALQLLSLMMLILVVWEVVVTAHIFRHALDTKMSQAVLLSMALYLVSLTLTLLIFPGKA